MCSGWRAAARWCDELLPLLEREINPQLDGHAAARLQAMTERYAAFIARERAADGRCCRLRPTAELRASRRAVRPEPSSITSRLGAAGRAPRRRPAGPDVGPRPGWRWCAITSPTRSWRSSWRRSSEAALAGRPRLRGRAARAPAGDRPPGAEFVGGRERRPQGARSSPARRRHARCANVDGRRPPGRGARASASAFDLVTARALAPLEVVAEYAAPLLRVGGTLVAWRGRRDPESEARGGAGGRRARDWRSARCVPVDPVSRRARPATSICCGRSAPTPDAVPAPRRAWRASARSAADLTGRRR